jgi:NTE family protein
VIYVSLRSDISIPAKKKMDKTDFTNAVHSLVRDLQRDLKGKIFSDASDGDYQYVDLVMEGGGVLGIALVGFTYVLERVGLRFIRIGGASAGAINALLLAGLDSPSKEKSEQIVELLANLDMFEFVDGNKHVKALVNAWMEDAGKIRLGMRAALVWDNVKDDLGLNPGKVFYEWVKDVLSRQGINTTRQLIDRMKVVAETVKKLDGTPISYEPESALAVVAADITTETKAVFPKMAPLYWANPDEVNPAEYVRASMSIPFFFQPYRIENIPRGDDALTRWEDLANYREVPPQSCAFIDGGIMSNFPIDLFHKPDRIPSAPTFGVKLGTNKRKSSPMAGPVHLAGAIFDAARHCLDYDFIARNPDYQRLVTCIDTGEHYWLDFKMSDEDKIDLFSRGARAADHFLREFNWGEYKKVREGVKAAFEASQSLRTTQPT